MTVSNQILNIVIISITKIDSTYTQPGKVIFFSVFLSFKKYI